MVNLALLVWGTGADFEGLVAGVVDEADGTGQVCGAFSGVAAEEESGQEEDQSQSAHCHVLYQGVSCLLSCSFQPLNPF